MLCTELAFFPASFDYCKTLNAKQKKLGSQRREATETRMMPIYISVYEIISHSRTFKFFFFSREYRNWIFLSPIHAHGSNLVLLKWLFSFDRPFPVISNLSSIAIYTVLQMVKFSHHLPRLCHRSNIIYYPVMNDSTPCKEENPQPDTFP